MRSTSHDKAWDQVTWQEIEIGGVLTEPGCARAYRTGDWRSHAPGMGQKPLHQLRGLLDRVPGAGHRPRNRTAISRWTEYCKGCGICAKECVTGCIKMPEEE